MWRFGIGEGVVERWIFVSLVNEGESGMGDGARGVCWGDEEVVKKRNKKELRV